MKTLTADISLNIAGKPMQLKINVPDKKTSAYVLLKPLRDITQLAEDLAIEEEVSKGNKISCEKGCGACCSQLVPVTQVEARYLVRLVERMPKARKQVYKARFLEIYDQLEQAGLIEQLMNPESIGENVIEFGLKYFDLGIPCPFLEDSSCSIHAERPLRCREYLVTNPAANCSHPTRDNIQRVEYPAHLSRLLTAIYQPWTRYPQKWVPLSIIFSWVERHSEAMSLRHSKEWIEDALHNLSHQKTTENDVF